METFRQWGPEDEPDEPEIRLLSGPEDEPEGDAPQDEPDDDAIEDLDPTIDRRLALEFDPLS